LALEEFTDLLDIVDSEVSNIEAARATLVSAVRPCAVLGPVRRPCPLLSLEGSHGKNIALIDCNTSPAYPQLRLCRPVTHRHGNNAPSPHRPLLSRRSPPRPLAAQAQPNMPSSPREKIIRNRTQCCRVLCVRFLHCSVLIVMASSNKDIKQ